MKRASRFPTLLLAGLVAAGGVLPATSTEVKVKNLTHVQGVRTNPLVGYGLVVGLNGTGDGTQAVFTTQSVANALQRMGITVSPEDIRVRNVAAVMVTAELPPFARAGSRVDVTVSSLGDAKSLLGGTLLMTPLLAGDRQTYVVAQGVVTVGGFSAGGGGSGVAKNHPTAGRVPGGGMVEKEAIVPLEGRRDFRVVLADPDFNTAARMSAAIDAAFGAPVAHAENAGAVLVRAPDAMANDPVGFLAAVGEVLVTPDTPARVVLNERTGTVVMGGEVRLSRVAVAHGNLSISISTDYLVSQPPPFSEKGRTVVVPSVGVTTEEDQAQMAVFEATTSVDDLVAALNTLGVTPRDLIAIFQALEQSGALRAELVVM